MTEVRGLRTRDDGGRKAEDGRRLEGKKLRRWRLEVGDKSIYRQQ